MSPLELFIHASASQGIEQKVEALQLLETELPSFNFATIEPHQCDALLEALALAVKSPQIKLYPPALSILPSFFKTLVATSNNLVSNLKLLLPSITPTLFERLADAKERTRELAHSALLEIYRIVTLLNTSSPASLDPAATPSQPKPTPFATISSYMDKELKNDGFAHKSPRGREQVLSLLVSCVRQVPAFPVKQYVPLTIKLLEDQNESVRSAAKDAVITLYNETSIKAMRNDIKKELTKQQIRQSIVDVIMAQLNENTPRALDASRVGSILELVESTSSSRRETLSSLPSAISTPAKLGAPPPSAITGGSAAPEPDPIMVSSERDLEREFANFSAAFAGKETEQNWESRELALQRLRGLCRGNGVQMEIFGSLFQTVLDPVTKTVSCQHVISRRYARNSHLANNLKSKLDPLGEILLTNLLKLSSQSKKLVITASTNALTVLLRRTTYNVKYLQHFLTASTDKSTSTRAAAAGFIKTVVEKMVGSQDDKMAFEKSGGVEMVEKFLQKGLQDANAAVRETGKEIFSLLQTYWSERAESLLGNLDPTTKKAVLRQKASTASLRPRASASVLAMKRSQSALGFAKPALPSSREIPSKSPSPVEDSADNNKGLEVPLTGSRRLMRTPVKSSLSISQTASSMASAASAEHESLRMLLSSTGLEERVRGCGILLALLQEDASSGTQASEFKDFVGQLRPDVAAIFLDDSEEMVQTVYRAEFLRLLHSAGLVSTEMAVPRVLAIKRRVAVGEQTRVECDQFLNYLRRTCTIPELLQILIGNLEQIVAKIASNREGNLGGWAEATEGMLEELVTTIVQPDSSIPKIAVLEYFADASRLHSCVNVLVHLLSCNASSAAESSATAILRVLYGMDRNTFVAALETHEPSTVERIARLIGTAGDDGTRGFGGMVVAGRGEGETLDGLSRIEGGEGATMMDLTFEQSTMFNLEGRAVCDETLPDGFADISIRSSNIPEDGEGSLSRQNSRNAKPPSMQRSIPRTPPPLPSAERNLGQLRERPSGGMVAHAPHDGPSSYEASNSYPHGEKPPLRSLVRWKRDTHAVLFSSKTPTPHRPTKADGAKELPKLLTQIADGSATNSTMRRLIRLSGTFAVTDEASEEQRDEGVELWDRWFEETLGVVLGVLRENRAEKVLQETCLLLLKTMMLNQTMYFRRHEKELLNLLLICRSDASGIVSGSAEDAIETAVDTLDRPACFHAVTDLLSGWDLSDFGRGKDEWVLPRAGPVGGGDSVMGRSGVIRPGEFQPSPASSAFQFLAKVAVKSCGGVVEGVGVMERVGGVAVKGLSSRIPEIRKSSTFCLVDMHACGIDIWRWVGDSLSDSQRKLLAVFINRQRAGCRAVGGGRGGGGMAGGMAGVGGEDRGDDMMGL
ncbi:suppressor of tub2 mutation [Rhizophlyctis rosea]|nr:suppressor of tub2 mutation [Rhizophlyctis rosea]